MRIGSQIFCMNFGEYMKVGWNIDMAVAGEDLIPNCDTMKTTEQVIADRKARERNFK